MKLPDNVYARAAACAIAACLAALTGACAGDGGAARLAAAPATDPYGPRADYPVVLGDPFMVDGEAFTPGDTLNYDEVGYAALDPQGGEGITIAHKTLPLPSYVEVTSLDSGKTVLARVERRGPMTTRRLIALSPGAAQALGVGTAAAVRVRRVNPPEYERAPLRRGLPAPGRMETPQSLLAVLREKLPAGGAGRWSASLSPDPARVAQAEAEMGPLSGTRAADATAVDPADRSRFDAAFGVGNAAPTPTPAPAPAPAPTPPARTAMETNRAPGGTRRQSNQAYPLPSSGQPASWPATHPQPTPVPDAAPAATRTPTKPAPSPTVDGQFAVQAAAFANRANAERAARALGGTISEAGRFHRVRTGPYASREAAEAALAKVRAAGYGDATVVTTG